MMKAYDEIFLENGVGFYQEKEGFRFGHDAILLADFIVEFAKAQQKNLEIGTGNGILPILLSQRGFVSKEYCAVDILESNIDLAKQNAENNGVSARFVCQDIRNFSEKNAYTQIFANPPYMSPDMRFAYFRRICPFCKEDFSSDRSSVYGISKPSFTRTL